MNKHSQKFRPTKHSREYCHFDILIWQLPAWSTIVFVAVLSAYVNLCSLAINPSFPIDPTLLLLIGASAFFLSGYYALLRWRIHQRYTEKIGGPKPPVVGAQAMLQFVTGTETAAILFLLISHFGKMSHEQGHRSLLFLLACCLMLFTIIGENQVRKHPCGKPKKKE